MSTLHELTLDQLINRITLHSQKAQYIAELIRRSEEANFPFVAQYIAAEYTRGYVKEKPSAEVVDLGKFPKIRDVRDQLYEYRNGAPLAPIAQALLTSGVIFKDPINLMQKTHEECRDFLYDIRDGDRQTWSELSMLQQGLLKMIIDIYKRVLQAVQKGEVA